MRVYLRCIYGCMRWTSKKNWHFLSKVREVGKPCGLTDCLGLSTPFRTVTYVVDHDLYILSRSKLNTPRPLIASSPGSAAALAHQCLELVVMS